MENDTMFYILGSVLIVSAVLLALMGLRAKEFPSTGVFRGLIVVFTALVLATTVFAVRSAGDEQRKREANEPAAAESQAAGQAAGVAEANQPGAGGQEPNAQGASLKVTSPADGSLKFEPATLDTKPGTITLAYTNPSPVPHSIALESPDGQILDQSQTGANGDFAVTAQVKPGKYAYFCTVPGHRQAGMEGTLTVK